MAIMTGVMLTVMAVQDWRTGKIAAWCPMMCIAAGVIIRIVQKSLGTADFWIGLLVGLFALAISAVSCGQLGIGDGWAVAACGVCLGWRTVILLVFESMVLFVAAGVVGMLRKGWNGKKAMPYIPYLWAAFMINLLIGG